jgi:predicted dienelactone hydrolase
MKRKCWFVLTAMAVAALVLSPGSTSASSAAASVKGSNSYRVASTIIVFTDHSRPTPANNGSPALPYRTLSTLVVYPEQSSSRQREFPLVVYSHGFGATAASAMPTLESLASHGYVVAAPDFPLSTTGLPGGLDLLDYVHQPGDVSFVITQMLKLDRTNGSPVHGEIDAHRIGVAGHSLGAVTTLAVSYNSCCRDARINAAIEMDGELNVPIGPEGNFSGTYFNGHDPPLLVVNGTKDTIGPYAISEAIYSKAPAPKYFLSLIGAPHEGFAMEPWSPVVNDTIAAFFDRYLGAGKSLAQIKQAGSKPGVTTIQVSAR